MARRLLLLLVILAAVVIVCRQSLRPPRTPSYYAFGQGPTVVMVHGLGSQMQHWLPTARILARHHRVVLVELPGHGLSPMPAPFSLEQAAATLDEAIRDATDGPVVLVGHSVGGLVAAKEALLHPERVRGLVLIETALKPQIPPGPREVMLARLDHDYDRLIHEAYLSFGRDSLQGERLYAEVARMEPIMVKSWIRLALFADLAGQMRKLLPPMLAVLAPHSWEAKETWPQVAKALGYDGVPRVEPVRVENAGHFLMLDQPQTLAEHIARFVLGASPSTVVSTLAR
ncbi:MAG TPA: alpha/beta hydrolase [Candidatus Eisenbacteria bacterium]|nr:alpha/beta hydrolase [Candidatus Eisenbacteria bacterium]